MSYPAIRYELDNDWVKHSNNKPYARMDRYSVTLITDDPTNTTRLDIGDLPYCNFDRFYTADQLNHYTFNLYF